MFTGIVETTGLVKEVIPNKSNLSFWIGSPISNKLKVDQSICHDGVCLTVEELREGEHRVTAIRETLKKTNLGSWQPGTIVNLERSLLPTDRIDGHIVQGHVDCKAACISKKEKKGSWEFTFGIPKRFAAAIIEKGAITVNGISLTCFDVRKKCFTVAIIPYTFTHTNIHSIEKESTVNIEFDIVGKYISRHFNLK